jgi:hemolysin activation/secretion protein
MGRYLLLILLWPCWLAHAADTAAPTFDILEYVVEGNTVLPALAIERAVYQHLGEKKTIKDVEAAREALEKVYHATGYLTVFVGIPEQKVEEGVVRLQVVQGEVERLRVTGSRYFSLNEIKARVPELAEGNVPYFPEVQEQLVGVGRSADRRVTPVLRPGREPGKLEVELKVADRFPLHGSVELNDRYSANTTRLRLAGNVRWDNLWQKDHSVGISYQTAPLEPQESSAISATYSIPLASGNYLAGYWVHTDSNVASLGTLGVIGKGDIYGMRWVYPLRAAEGFSHSLTLGPDYKSFGQTVALQGADSFNTPITYLPFTVAWSGNWEGKGGGAQVNLAANFHLRDLVGDDQEFANKRFRATSNYIYLRGDLRRTWVWESAGTLELRAGFQVAGQPLISNEGYTLGGADTVRGYLESEVIGDRGYVLGVEWHTRQIAPKWSEAWGANDLHALAFVEGGSARVLDPLPGQTASFTLASSGVGLRLKTWGSLTAALDLVQALRDAGTTRSGDKRVHVNLRYAF